MGEPGVDDGGPQREFFRLLLPEIGNNNNLFIGPITARVPSHNALALKDQVFFYIGQIFALSLLFDGPGIQCLAPSVANYLLGNTDLHPSWEEIPYANVLQEMKKVCS